MQSNTPQVRKSNASKKETPTVTFKLPSTCISLCGSRLAIPTDVTEGRQLSIHSKPAVSCPLKCVNEINTSASRKSERTFTLDHPAYFQQHQDYLF